MLVRASKHDDNYSATYNAELCVTKINIKACQPNCRYSKNVPKFANNLITIIIP